MVLLTIIWLGRIEREKGAGLLGEDVSQHSYKTGWDYKVRVLKNNTATIREHSHLAINIKDTRHSSSPWTGHQHCGHSGAAGQQTWCRPCGLRCAGLAGGPYPWCHAPAVESPLSCVPAAERWQAEWSHPERNTLNPILQHLSHLHTNGNRTYFIHWLTSVAMLWFPSFSSRYRTTSKWFSWAAM